MVHIRLIGDWLPRQVLCGWADSTFDPRAEVRELIEHSWADAQKGDAQKGAIHLFDGPMCRLERITAVDGNLRLLLSRTSYKSFLGTNLRNAADIVARFGPATLANAVGLSCALISSDSQLMLGQRNDRVAYYPGRIHPFAGALEPRDPLDIFAEVRRELGEELSLAAGDIAEIRCIGMVEDAALRQPELVFLVQTRRSANEIHSTLDATEHCSSLAVKAEASAAGEIIADPLLTPVAVGTMLLWGRRAFGAEWFAEIAAVGAALAAMIPLNGG